jgi:SAM-dependent MidA family methyltransferase
MTTSSDDLDASGPAFRRVARRLEEAAGFPSFCRYMERCLYDPTFGYYSTGRVAFGAGRHFATCPEMLSPLFGWMVAELALTILDRMIAGGSIPPEAPFTVLELGAGEGCLARDVLSYVDRCSDAPRWGPLASRLRYVAGERSAALRQRIEEQLARFLRKGNAEIRDINAQSMHWDGPFHGLVIANELIDSFPCEKLHLYGSESAVRRVHTVPRVGGKESCEAFWRIVEQAAEEHDPEGAISRVEIGELEVPLSLGWLTDGDETMGIPPALSSYLDELAPIIGDLAACGRLPAVLGWAPGLHRFAEDLGTIVKGKERCGAAVVIDYGGTSRYVIDRGAYDSHLRVYGPDPARAHAPTVYDAPGFYDITWNTDFTELARLARASGLDAPFFGHQAALEKPPVDLEAAAALNALADRLHGEKNLAVSAARRQARARIDRFRRAEGFRMLLLSDPRLTFFRELFGPGDPLELRELSTLAPGIAPWNLNEALEAEGLPVEIARILKPCGDPVADLSDRQLYEFRRPVLDILARHGWLVPPGGMAGAAPGG